jgi:glutamate synthase (NADPH/NADH) small chain
VLVVGGGNVAVDAARTALRLGATEVTLAYRRTRADMPARAEEITHAVEEGIRIRELLSPLRIEGDEGQVMGMCVRPMRLVLPNPPDSDARPRPEPVPGASEELLPADTVVVAIGTRANPYLKEIADVATNQRGYLMTDKDSRTSNARIFAGGDAVTGAATVIEAMGAGKTAAAAMDKQWG